MERARSMLIDLAVRKYKSSQISGAKTTSNFPCIFFFSKLSVWWSSVPLAVIVFARL